MTTANSGAPIRDSEIQMELCEECNRLVIREAPFRRVGDLEMDVENHRIWVKGEEIRLQAGEFAVLERLMAAPGKLFDKWDLLEIYRAGGHGSKKDINDYTPESALRLPNLIICKIRKKIGYDRIQTESGIGYRLVAQREKEPA